MAWHSVVAGACLVLGAVDVVWLGGAAEDAFAAAAPAPTPDPTPIGSPDPTPIPIPSPDPIPRPDPIPIPSTSTIPSTIPSTSTVSFTIHFGRDEDTLGDVERAALDELAPRLTGAVSVEGHADERGSDDYNEELSRRRAEAVAAYLEQHGVARPTVRAFGESKPLGSPHLDRRVEIHQEHTR